jgi:hypothetical protein
MTSRSSAFTLPSRLMFMNTESERIEKSAHAQGESSRDARAAKIKARFDGKAIFPF